MSQALARMSLRIATESMAISQHIEADYDSVAVLSESVAIGFNEDGIFRLNAGTGDAQVDESGNSVDPWPIDTLIRFASVAPLGARRKRIRAIVVTGEFEGCMEYRLTGDEDQQTDWIRMTPVRVDNNQTTMKAGAPRSFYGSHIVLELQNLNGNDFSIGSVDIYPYRVSHWA